MGLLAAWEPAPPAERHKPSLAKVRATHAQQSLQQVMALITVNAMAWTSFLASLCFLSA
jgi:hypothetical protein